MSDIKDSGDIEQDMDLGLLLYRDDYYNLITFFFDFSFSLYMVFIKFNLVTSANFLNIPLLNTGRYNLIELIELIV